MADGTTVDSLQIEIEASSAEAEKRVDALAAALERLKKATTGFGNISDRIRDIGESASESPAAEKTKKRKEALARATKPDTFTVSANVDLEKAGSQLESTDRKIEKAKESIAELNEQIRMLGFAHDKKQGEEAIAQLNEELSKQQGILDSLIEKREKLSSMIVNGAVKEPKQTNDQWADVKEQLRGSTLGNLVGDTGSVDEAVSRMVDLNDQVSLLNVKLDGLQEKLRGAFEKGNQSQVASYTAQIQKLKDQLSELQDAPEQAQNSQVEMVEPGDSLQKKLGILQRIAETVQKMSGTKIDIGSAEGLKELLGKDLSLQSLIPKGTVSGLNALGGAFGGLKDKMLGVAAAHPVLAAALVGVTALAKTGGKAFMGLAQTAGAATRNGFELLAAGAKKLTLALKNLVIAGVGKAVSGLKSIGKSVVKNVTTPFAKSFETISRWKKMLGSALFYSTVFRGMSIISNGIKEGITNLYEYSRLAGTEFAPAMNSLATSALYLKNSLGAMAAPLVQAVAPVVDMLIDKFVALINVIGKAFAMLTGKSVYTQAKKHAVEYGEAANKASKATKDFLLGIDELNVISDTAGGGGGAASDFGSMFEEVEIDQDQFDWVKQIREAIENGEWRSVGELVANKLNEIVDSWDSYGWGQKLGTLINNGLNVAYGFLDKFDFENLGRKVANGLNGIFDTVDWDLLGRTFAAEWNALFDFIYGFATTLKWHEIGLDISQAINGFLDELDPSKAANAVSAFAAGLFDLLNTAIVETNWNVLGDKLGQFISEVDWQGAIYGALSIVTNGLAALKDGLDSFLRSWTWQDTAQQTYTAVNQAFSDVDWGGLGNTLGNAFTTAFNFLRETIAKIEWASIGSDIAAFLNGIDWAGLLSGVATTIASAFNAVVSTLSALVRDLEWEEVGKAVGNAINDFFATFDFASALTGLANLVQGIISGLSAAIETTKWDEIGKKIVNALKQVDWKGLLSDLGKLVGDTIVAALDLFFSLDPVGIIQIGADIVAGLLLGIGDALLGIGTWLKEHLVDPIVNGVKSLFGIHSPSTVFAEIGGFLIEGLLQGVSQTWHSIVDFFATAFQDWWDNTVSPWFTLEKWMGLVSSIKESVKKTWDETVGQWVKDISDWWTTNVAPWFTLEKWAGIAKSIKDSIIKSLSDMVSNWKTNIANWWSENVAPWFKLEKWTELVKTIKDSIIKSLGDMVTQWAKDIKSWWNEHIAPWFTFEKWKELGKNALDGLFSGISGLFSDAVQWGKDICRGISDGISSAKHLVTSAASNVASGIKGFLHFSEPDVGPLSDFHTYMPDMLQLMAKGIKDNSNLAVSAASDLADSMSRVFQDIEPVQPQYAVRQNPYAAIPASFAQAQSSGASISNYSSTTTNVSNDNSDVIDVLNAGFQALIETINSQDYGTYLDGKTLMQSIERAQRNRGANIMGGGVLG